MRPLRPRLIQFCMCSTLSGHLPRSCSLMSPPAGGIRNRPRVSSADDSPTAPAQPSSTCSLASTVAHDAPVDQGTFAIREPALPDISTEDSHCSWMMYVCRVTALCDQSHDSASRPERSLHRLDVLHRPVASALAFFIAHFRRQTPRIIPAHRIQHAVAFHPIRPCQHVADRVVARGAPCEPPMDTGTSPLMKYCGPGGFGLPLRIDSGVRKETLWQLRRCQHLRQRPGSVLCRSYFGKRYGRLLRSATDSYRGRYHGRRRSPGQLVATIRSGGGLATCATAHALGWLFGLCQSRSSPRLPSEHNHYAHLGRSGAIPVMQCRSTFRSVGNLSPGARRGR